MRIAILSDVHANLPALQAVFGDIDQKKRRVDQYFCLGDVIGYGMEPVETIRELNKRLDPDYWVAGNHEELYWGDQNVGFDQKAEYMMEYERHVIHQDSEVKQQLDTLPCRQQPIRTAYFDGYMMTLTHSGPEKNHATYPFPWDEDSKLPALMNTFQALEQKPDMGFFDRHIRFRRKPVPRILFTGHTHVRMLYYQDSLQGRRISLKIENPCVDLQRDCNDPSLIIINPGSVGYSRDGSPMASYVILDTSRRQVEFYRIRYQFVARKYAPAAEWLRANINHGTPPIHIDKTIDLLKQYIQQAPLAGEDADRSEDWNDYFRRKPWEN